MLYITTVKFGGYIDQTAQGSNTDIWAWREKNYKNEQDTLFKQSYLKWNLSDDHAN